MPVPSEYSSVYQWWAAILGQLAEDNNELKVFQVYWGNLTTQQQTYIKNQMQAKIDTGIASLEDIKGYIQTL